MQKHEDKKKHLMLIHGRNFKPDKEDLKELWFEAIESGLKRDFYKNALGEEIEKTFKEINKTFVYYGDISNEFLESKGDSYDQEEDLQDRYDCLKNLTEYKNKDDFLGEIGKSNYERLDISPYKEWLAGTFAGFLECIRLAERLIRKISKDIAHYWNPDSKFGSEVRWKLTEPLQKALADGEDIFLVSHSLGTMISYDVLWKFSHYGEYKKLREKLRETEHKLTTLVTLGSPLGNETIKKNLKGARAGGIRKYPTLIHRWENFSAEDDYISHDETLEDDYKKMEHAELVDSICDHRLYNLAVRKGKSNPHDGVGYLNHPKFVKVLGKWLVGD